MPHNDDESADSAVAALKQAFAETSAPAAKLRPLKPRPQMPYRSVGPLTGWLVALVGVQLATTLLSIVAMVLLRSFIDEQNATPFALARLIARTVDPLSRIFYLTSLLVFCFWVHRSYQNILALGSRAARFTPGWAVGSFFIPFLAFVRGVQVMRDLWIESQPLPEGHETRLQRSAPLVGWWWVTWIVSLLASEGVTVAPSLQRHDWMLLNQQATIVMSLDLIAGALFIAVLVGITRRQRDQWDDIVRRQPTLPRSDLLR